MKTRKAVTLALLLSMSIVLSIVESFLPTFNIPGAKLGLANIITLVLLYNFDDKDTFTMVILRIILVSILKGLPISSFLISLSGGLTAFFLMWFFKRLRVFSVISVSVMGSIGHSLGQIVMAIIILSTPGLVYYYPFLFLLAIPTGIFVGFSGNILSERLKEINVLDK